MGRQGLWWGQDDRAGIVLSIPLGFWLLSFIMNYFAIKVLGIPGQFVTYDLNLTYVGLAAVFALIFAVVGAFFPSYRAASFTPVEAMRPQMTSKGVVRAMSSSSMSPLKKLILRDILGHRARSLSTVISVALVLSLGLSFALSMTSFKEGIRSRINQNELWDIRVSFSLPQDGSALKALAQVKGVEQVEPYAGYEAEIAHGDRSTIIQVSELRKDTRMRRFQLSEGHPSPEGMIISGDVAHRLDIRVGDEVTLSTAFGRFKTRVSGVLQEFGSSEGYLLKETVLPTGAMLKIGPGEAGEVQSQLLNLPFVRTWVSKGELQEGWFYLMDEYYGMVVYAMDLVTLVLIVIGVFAFISAMEREWEFVILKALGFSRGISSEVISRRVCSFPSSAYCWACHWAGTLPRCSTLPSRT